MTGLCVFLYSVQVYFPMRSMVLFNQELDVPGLAELFKAKDVLAAAAPVVAAEGSRAGGEGGGWV